jgi:hypothetical protein
MNLSIVTLLHVVLGSQTDMEACIHLEGKACILTNGVETSKEF